MKSLKDFLVENNYISESSLKKNKKLIDGIEQWVVNEFSKKTQNQFIEENSSLIEKWLRKTFKKKFSFTKQSDETLFDFLNKER